MPTFTREWLRRRLGLPEKRLVVMKEVIINEVDPASAEQKWQENFMAKPARMDARLYPVRESYRQYWRRGYPPESVDRIGIMADSVAAYLGDSRDVRVIDRVNRFPVVKSLWILHPVSGPRLRNALKWFLPAGGLLYILSFALTPAGYIMIWRKWLSFRRTWNPCCFPIGLTVELRDRPA